MTSVDHTDWRSCGYLPHLDASDLVQHVVFRLADRLPPRIRDEIAAYSPAARADAVDAALDHVGAVG